MVPMINTPIPDNLAASLAGGTPPPARIKFADARELLPEWIIGVQSDPDRGTLLARLSRDIFDYKVRFGWAGAQPSADGTTSFEETSAGTCRLKDADTAAQSASK